MSCDAFSCCNPWVNFTCCPASSELLSCLGGMKLDEKSWWSLHPNTHIDTYWRLWYQFFKCWSFNNARRKQCVHQRATYQRWSANKSNDSYAKRVPLRSPSQFSMRCWKPSSAGRSVYWGEGVGENMKIMKGFFQLLVGSTPLES